MRSFRRVAWAVVSFALLTLCVVSVDPRRDVVAADAPKNDKAFDQTIQPFLTKYCNSCHNSEKNAGGVALDTYQNEAHARKDRKVWEMISRVIVDGEMPPKRSKTQPTKDEKTAVTGWIENSLLAVDCFGQRDPGRVTLRRLNRSEYNNTIRDLCGVNFNPADDFPSDDVGYGFDHIGDVLSVQPVLIEKYMAAADRVLEQGIGSLGRVKPELRKFNPFTLSAIPRSAKLRETNDKGKEVRRIVLTEDGAAFLEKVNFPGDGEYSFKITAWGTTVGKDKPKLVLRVDGKDIQSFPVEAERAKPKTFTASTKFAAGEKRVAMAFANPFTDQANGSKRTLGIEGLEIDGPIGGSTLPVSDSMKRIVAVLPKTDTEQDTAAEASLKDFARRAFRRPPTADEVTRLMKLYRTATAQGDPFEQAIKLPLKAILVSPHFLFRIEADPKEPEQVRTLNDFELATRLAYFLWSSTPDETLYRLAEKNELRKPGVLPAQIKRMLADPKATALTQNFAGQWLMLRNILSLSPDNGTFKTWDESLRQAIIRETELFFEHVVREDRSVLEFLDANYTFLNDRLSWHYGVPGVKGGEFRKVELKDRRRGGLVTQASILLVTSNPTRTSPVKRGKWVYENILGLTPPPAAPDVPELEKTELKGSLRQRMEQHRSNPACAGCHAKLDPLGFGLENFDGIGKWRDTDDGFKVDASGVLPDGSTFNGPAELRKVLLGKADMFRRCLAEKLLTYALGRGLDYRDKCVLDDLVKKLKSGNDTFSALVLGIVETDAFHKRRGKRSE
jgi:mono/diheme cytochrome c family protein